MCSEIEIINFRPDLAETQREREGERERKREGGRERETYTVRSTRGRSRFKFQHTSKFTVKCLDVIIIITMHTFVIIEINFCVHTKRNPPTK